MHMQGRAALQPVSAALEMNPKERALYLKQKHTGVTLTDDEATVASATAAGLRSFLRQASSVYFRALFPATCLLSFLLLTGCIVPALSQDQQMCQTLLSPCRCERSCIRYWAA